MRGFILSLLLATLQDFKAMVTKGCNFNPEKKRVLPITPFFEIGVRTTTKCGL
jgi:hypothetical protein